MSSRFFLRIESFIERTWKKMFTRTTLPLLPPTLLSFSDVLDFNSHFNKNNLLINPPNQTFAKIRKFSRKKRKNRTMNVSEVFEEYI
jgi:hypothetical protein